MFHMKHFLLAITLVLAAIGPSHADVSPKHIKVPHGIVCKDEEAIKVLRHLENDGAEAADFLWLGAEFAKSGACITLPEGTGVIVEQSDDDNGAICIRQDDGFRRPCGWTGIETVE